MGWGGVALIKFTGGPDLLLTVQVWTAFPIFSYIFQPRCEPPSSQFSLDSGITLGLHFGSFGIVLVLLFRA